MWQNACKVTKSPLFSHSEASPRGAGFAPGPTGNGTNHSLFKDLNLCVSSFSLLPLPAPLSRSPLARKALRKKPPKLLTPLLPTPKPTWKLLPKLLTLPLTLLPTRLLKLLTRLPKLLTLLATLLPKLPKLLLSNLALQRKGRAVPRGAALSFCALQS